MGNSSTNKTHSILHLRPAGIPSGSLVPWIFWSLWKARNRFVFEGYVTSPADTLTTAIKLAREWSLYSKPEKAKGKKNLLRVAPQVPDVTIVRSDAAWDALSKSAGFGWTIQDQPPILHFQSSSEFVASSLMAEALALREAVTTCRRLGTKTVRFELDSAQLVKCCNSTLVLVELHSVVADILALVSDLELVSFVWIPRELNGLADGLAKEALFVSEPVMVGDEFNALN